MNSRERILTALALKEPDRVPFADDVDQDVRVVLMGREDFTEAEFAKTLGLDIIDFQCCLAPVFCKREQRYGRDFILDGLIKTDKDLDLMVFPDPCKESFYDPVKRFLERNAREDFAVLAQMRGMDGVLYSMGVDGLSYALYENPKLIDKVWDRYVEWNCTVVERLNTIGIDFINSYNNITYNSGPIVSPQVIREVFLPKMKLISDTCKLPWVYHGAGNIMPIIDDILTLGMNGIHPIEPVTMDIKMFKEKYGNRVCLWGNIDLRYTLTRGTPEEVEEEVKQCIKFAAPGGGFILGSAGGLANYQKVENIWTMAKTVKRHGKYPLDTDLL